MGRLFGLAVSALAQAFYPATLAARHWLPFYATVFDTVEVNNTFYRLPAADTFAAWRQATPDGFCMAVKASRYLTHLKKLREPEEPVARLFDRLRALGSRLGPVLYQFPANFPINLERLEHFLRILPRRLRVEGGGRQAHIVRHVFEFRDPSWYVPEVFALLAAAGAALCLHDRAGSATVDAPAAPFLYVRFHGPGGRYVGRYPEDCLDGWATRLAGALKGGQDVFAYFNNDPEAAAIHDAQYLRAALTRAAAGDMVGSR